MTSIGRGAGSLLAKLRPPTGAADELDLVALHALPTPDAAAIEWANLLSNNGATDMWVQLARGLGERAGPQQATRATNLLRETREAVRAIRARSGELFDRPRPWVRAPGLETYVHRPATGSYPSVHAVGGHANARIMATLDPDNAGTYWWLAEQGAGARVVGRVHHPLDVVAGARLGTAAAGDSLAAHGYRPAPAPTPFRLDRLDAWDRFGHDSDAAARLLALMPADVRAAGAGTSPSSPLQAFFGARPPDNGLVF